MRISRDKMFMDICETVAKRSTCVRGNVGAVIVQEGRIVSMGYNGAPPGLPHCEDVGCSGGVPQWSDEVSRISRMQPTLTTFPDGCQRATHAEVNAVAFAARHGTPCDDAVMYCTHATCARCAAIVVAAGIHALVYCIPYRLTDGLELLDQANVMVRQYHE